MAKERTCIACLKSYQYCPSCGEYSKYPAWMAEFDTEECKEIFNAVSGFNIGIKSAETVKSVVNKYGVNDFNKFKPSIAAKLNQICKVEEPITEVVSTETEEVAPVIEETSITEEVSPAEVESEERPRRNNRRRINRN